MHGFRPYLRNALAFGGPILAYHVRGVVRPVLAGYKITHRCNLQCRHCPYWLRPASELDFQGVCQTMARLGEMGVRILILEGGEPMLWRDGNKNIRHVIEEARKYFRCVCLTTNGTVPWGDLELDRVWVSLDGPADIHDRIRGAGVFEKVWKNLANEGRGEAFISTTTNTLNAASIPDMISLLRGVVAGVTIQFHYPYQGLPDPLYVPVPERAPLLDTLMAMKREGYPVANSFLSLQELKKTHWLCEDKLLANAEPDGTILHGCYLKNRGPSVCELCGFSAHNEMSLAFQGKMESIVTGMRIFFGKTHRKEQATLSGS